MELAYLILLLKVAVLQASDIIYETESWRTLCKDHNQFLKYDQGFDNPKSFFKKKYPPFKCSYRANSTKTCCQCQVIFLA